MDNENEKLYTVTVHGVKVTLPVVNDCKNTTQSWRRDYAIRVAEDYLRAGFHLIEIREKDSQKIEVLWTIRDKE
jgi:hypothetical protein